jgi:hypothetical protein
VCGMPLHSGRCVHFDPSPLHDVRPTCLHVSPPAPGNERCVRKADGRGPVHGRYACPAMRCRDFAPCMSVGAFRDSRAWLHPCPLPNAVCSAPGSIRTRLPCCWDLPWQLPHGGLAALLRGVWTRPLRSHGGDSRHAQQRAHDLASGSICLPPCSCTAPSGVGMAPPCIGSSSTRCCGRWA